MSHTDLREQLIDTIDNRRFYKGFPPILYKDIEWLVDNCLLTEFTQQVTAARANEIQRICDEVGLFTKKRNKYVYNVQLPIRYLTDRIATLQSTLIKDKEEK